MRQQNKLIKLKKKKKEGALLKRLVIKLNSIDKTNLQLMHSQFLQAFSAMPVERPLQIRLCRCLSSQPAQESPPDDNKKDIAISNYPLHKLKKRLDLLSYLIDFINVHNPLLSCFHIELSNLIANKKNHKTFYRR